MKVKVAFTLDINIDGDSVPRSDVAEAIAEWLEDLEFGDAIIDYIAEEWDKSFRGIGRKHQGWNIVSEHILMIRCDRCEQAWEIDYEPETCECNDDAEWQLMVLDDD